MSRGRESEVGSTRVAPNGYHYTRTDKKWELTHKLVAETTLGRSLHTDERCRFRDRDRTNLKPDNIEVYKTKTRTVGKRRAVLQARIEELQAELADLDEEDS